MPRPKEREQAHWLSQSRASSKALPELYVVIDRSTCG